MSANHIDRVVFDLLEDDDAHSTKRRKSTISLRNPTSNSASPKLLNNRCDRTQSPQPALTAMGSQQLGYRSAPPRELRLRAVTRSDPYKCPISAIKLATTSITASAALEPTKLEEPQSVAVLAAPGKEREIRDIN
jgi:hypothetical protein